MEINRTFVAAVVNSKSLKRNIKLVVATFQEKGKKTQTRKLFFFYLFEEKIAWKCEN